MKPINFLLLLITGIMFSSCEFFKSTEVKNVPEEPEAIMIFLDGTQSYHYLDKAKRNAIKIIETAPGGSTIMVRYITEKSATPSNSILSCRMPIPPEKPQNEFDVQESLEYEKRLLEHNGIYEKIYAAIIDAPSPKANRTDIIGALYTARRTQAWPGIKRVYFFSDMNDNARLLYPDFFLPEVNVYIYDFQDDPANTFDDKRLALQKFLAKYQVKSVEFKDVDEL